MTRIAVVILLALMGCGADIEPAERNQLGGMSRLTTYDHGPYRCVVYDQPYGSGLWCERREEPQP